MRYGGRAHYGTSAVTFPKLEVVGPLNFNGETLMLEIKESFMAGPGKYILVSYTGSVLNDTATPLITLTLPPYWVSTEGPILDRVNKVIYANIRKYLGA
jgi:hypothetical protein